MGEDQPLYNHTEVVMFTPLGSGHVIFAFSTVIRRLVSAVHCHTLFPIISRKSIYPIFTKFGMGVYWVNSLHGIAFGEDSSTVSRGRRLKPQGQNNVSC